MAYINYKVVKGDTLGAIAQKYGTTVNAIKFANSSIKDVNKIYVGQVLKIPISEASEGNSNAYEEIGRAFETALKDVENLNSVKRLSKLLEG